MTDRPSMKIDDHPDHNMPESEHHGVQLAATFSSFINALPPTDSRLSQDPGPKRPGIVPVLKPAPVLKPKEDK